MVGFMCEALHKVGSSTHAFFRAVDLMDMYFKSSTASVPKCELHLIGVTCMLLASKMEDAVPFSVEVANLKIAHGGYSVEDILAMELEILSVLQFEFGRPALLEIAERVALKRHSLNFESLEPLVITLSKTVCFDHKLLEQHGRE